MSFLTHANETAELTVIARAPFQIYYEGKAQVVSAVNAVGEFDVLPGHADFFSMLSPGSVIIQTISDPIILDIANGIIAVRDNEVMLFLNM